MTPTDAKDKKPVVESNVREVKRRDRSNAPKNARKLVEAPEKVGEDVKAVTAWYKKNATDTVQVRCLGCGEIIAIEAQMPGRYDKNHTGGYIVVPLNDKLLSYRKRIDATMGYSCVCGNSTILLPEEAELRGAVAIPPHVEDRIKKKIEQGKANKSKKPVLEIMQFERVRVK